MDRLKKWSNANLTAIILVISFIPIYIASQMTGAAFAHFGSTSIEFLHHEYYRWLTCIFLHFNFTHIFFNSIALLAVGSLISPFLGKWRTLFLFLLCGILAEVGCSFVINYSEPVYGGGSSGGIFALIASLTVCYLRFPQDIKLKFARLDVILVIAFFIFANDNIGSFLTHAFGFIAGIVVSFILVLTGAIRSRTFDKLQKAEEI